LVAKLKYLFNSLSGGMDLACGGIDRRTSAILAAQQRPDGSALDLAADVPESGLNPVIAPAEVAGFADVLAGRIDVIWIKPAEIGAKQPAETFAFALKGNAGSQTLHTIVRRQAQEGKAVDRLGVAEDPGRIEGLGQWNGDVEELDAVNLHWPIPFILLSCTSVAGLRVTIQIIA
jgi:hypothetical protein